MAWRAEGGDTSEDRLRLSDVGKLARRTRRRIADAEARRPLFRLYQGGLEVDASRLDAVVERTDGATASFLKELLRRGALLAAQQSRAGPIVVSADQLDAALDELLDTRNAMTRVLLGGRNPGGAHR